MHRGREPVNARRHERLHAVRDRWGCSVGCAPVVILANDRALVDEALDDLLDEEGVALGLGENLRSQCLRQVRDVEQAADQLLALGIGQRTEGERGREAAPCRELGMRLRELGPSRGEQDERAFRAGGDTLEHLGDWLARPVEVLD